jgi:hypothetical protein
MIAMFVGNQDRGKLAVMAVVPRQARAGFARGKSAVEQERGAATLDQRGIAAAAAAENGKSQPGLTCPCSFPGRSQLPPTF